MIFSDLVCGCVWYGVRKECLINIVLFYTSFCSHVQSCSVFKTNLVD